MMDLLLEHGARFDVMGDRQFGPLLKFAGEDSEQERMALRMVQTAITKGADITVYRSDDATFKWLNTEKRLILERQLDVLGFASPYPEFITQLSRYIYS
jgi:hypothetical protein